MSGAPNRADIARIRLFWSWSISAEELSRLLRTRLEQVEGGCAGRSYHWRMEEGHSFRDYRMHLVR